MVKPEGRAGATDLERKILAAWGLPTVRALSRALKQADGDVYGALRGRSRASDTLIQKLVNRADIPPGIEVELRAQQATWEKPTPKSKRPPVPKLKHAIAQKLLAACDMGLTAFAKFIGRNDTFLTEVFSGRKRLVKSLFKLINEKFPNLPENVVAMLRKRMAADTRKRTAKRKKRLAECERRKAAEAESFSAAPLIEAQELGNVSLLARALHVRESYLCAVAQGRRPVSPRMISRIEARFPAEAEQLIELFQVTQEHLTQRSYYLDTPNGPLTAADLAVRVGYEESYLTAVFIGWITPRPKFWARLARTVPNYSIACEWRFSRRT